MIFDSLARATQLGDPRATQSRSSFWGMPTAGVQVNDVTAFKLGAFFACVRVVSEDLMPIPWPVFQTTAGAREPRPESTVHDLLNRRANDETPAAYWRQAIVAHAASLGNGYAEIERNGRGDPISLWLLDPTRMDLERDSQNRLWYKYQNDGGRDAMLAPSNVFHLRGPSYDAITGYNITQLAKEAISLGLAAQMFGAAYFGNGAIPAGLIKHKPDGRMAKLTEEGIRNLYQSWEARLKGAGKRKVMYVEKDLEYEPLGGKPEESQLSQTQISIVNEICRWFRVPPHKVMELSRATFSNIEHQNRAYVDDAMIPWATRLQAEADMKLLPLGWYTKMNMRALLRGDSKARSEYYKSMQDRGNLTINDVLRLEDLPEIGPAGDVRMVPRNMTTLDKLGEGKDPGEGKNPGEGEDGTDMGN